MCVCVRVCVSRLSGNECVKITLDAVNFGQWLRFSLFLFFLPHRVDFGFVCLALLRANWLIAIEAWFVLNPDTKAAQDTHTRTIKMCRIYDIYGIYMGLLWDMSLVYSCYGCGVCTLLTFAYTWLCFVNLRYQATYHYSSKTGRESEIERGEREKVEKLNSSLV